MIPDKVIIGCYEYKVEVTDEPLILNGQEKSGIIDYSAATIKISAKNGTQAQEHTFWHEVMHGIVHYRNVDLKDSSEETLVDEIATGLYSLMKTNRILPGQKEAD